MVAMSQKTLINLYESLLAEWDLYEDTRYGDRIDECLCWIETMSPDAVFDSCGDWMSKNAADTQRQVAAPTRIDSLATKKAGRTEQMAR